MSRKTAFGAILGLFLWSVAGAQPSQAAGLTIGYSDWPGWVAWQVAIDKGWLKEAGLDVSFQWFDYSASMDAFAAGKIDANLMTNGDTLVTGSGGGKGIIIMATDYSNGNDTVIAKPGIKDIKALKGKKVGVEVGLVDHLLLLDAFKKSGMSPKDVTLVNAKTNELPQVLASGQVDAVACWQPIAGQAMKGVPGSRPVWTSKQSPGLIYDVLAVSPTKLAANKDAWIKLIKVWGKVVSYINDPKTQPDALKIMSARVGLTPDTYKPLLGGTKLLDLKANVSVFKKGAGLSSMYGSTKIADDFNVANAVYKKSEDVDSYIDPSFVGTAAK
ncbi:MAG TPA: ABC transporter substrate-binding protein [Pseudolabrys sp.]|nr:ABC transporter substrate-binding protein [Pseudolabrys sp.]